MVRRWWWFILFALLLVACGGSATPNGSAPVTSTVNPQATATRTTELTQIATATRAVELTQVAPLVASQSPSPLPVTAVTLAPPPASASAPNPPVTGAATATPARGTGSPTTPAAAATNGSAPAGSTVQVVTVNPGDVVRIRSKPSTDADTAVEVAGGTDLVVIEANVPGSDGTSRWFHVLSGAKEGYVRGDLVGPPHTAVVATKASGTATGTPTP